ncbi:sulfur carrier protein ThiS [Conchiformibius kuhniae]|uniref:Sulfur carrier protein ThiS n=1 Tax=Conchiformibius kuhniae TaxID=211502 RepID=A0A8T9MYN4_9NEIS|nr:sulfur carrier protein ThiS [Conchiformibius kuhniae]UOP05598.1 sulfur carrier protein ThiS [Conchiformibius kuhniae]
MTCIVLNGEHFDFSGETLADLLAAVQAAAPFAAAVNTAFVAKTAYADTHLREGDKVDIVSPVGGG